MTTWDQLDNYSSASKTAETQKAAIKDFVQFAEEMDDGMQEYFFETLKVCEVQRHICLQVLEWSSAIRGLPAFAKELKKQVDHDRASELLNKFIHEATKKHLVKWMTAIIASGKMSTAAAFASSAGGVFQSPFKKRPAPEANSEAGDAETASRKKAKKNDANSEAGDGEIASRKKAEAGDGETASRKKAKKNTE